MKNFTAGFVVIAFLIPFLAFGDLSSLDPMKAKYKEVKTLTAEFTQKQKNLSLGKTKESTGTIFISRPDKFRWQTVAPDPSVMVSNGRKVWYYTPPFREGEAGQLLTKAAADVQSKLAVDLLSGQGDLKKTFQVHELGGGRFDLKPLKPAGDVAHIELYLEKSTNLVYKLVLFTNLGNQTELELKNVTLNSALSDAMFRFEPPKGEKVEEIN